MTAAAADHFTLFAAFRSYGSAAIGTFNGTPQHVSGGDPAVPGPQPLVYRDGSLQLPRRSGSSGSLADFTTSSVECVIQTSGDLGEWVPFDADLVGSSSVTPGTGGMELRTLNLTGGPGPARFWHLMPTRR